MFVGYKWNCWIPRRDGGSHGSAKAVILGLLGQEPETWKFKIDHELREVREKRRLILNKNGQLTLMKEPIYMHRNRSLPFHRMV